MNLKLKRLVRTTSSEQYAVFDLDQTDEDDQLPLTIGKLDLHYTAEGVYGTMLLWDDASRGLRASYRRAFIQVLLEDIIQPMGVPNEYVIEFFAPTLDLYEVFHNVEVDEEAEDDLIDAVDDAVDINAVDEDIDDDMDGDLDDDGMHENDGIEDDIDDDELRGDAGSDRQGGPYTEYVSGGAESEPAARGISGRTANRAARRTEENLQDEPPSASSA